MNKSAGVRRFQWMRNASTNERRGNRMEIRPLDEDAFHGFVLPRIRPDFARNLSEYLTKVPEATHYCVIWRDGDDDWKFVRLGSLTELLKEPLDSPWAKEVQGFDTPEAIDFGDRTDED